MFINHGGIEQVKLWCEVRSIGVVYLQLCACVLQHLKTYKLVLCKTVENSPKSEYIPKTVIRLINYFL